MSSSSSKEKNCSGSSHSGPSASLSECNGGVGAKRRECAEHDGEVDEVADETSRREYDRVEEKSARVIKSSASVRTREDRIDAESLALTLRRSRASYAD